LRCLLYSWVVLAVFAKVFRETALSPFWGGLVASAVSHMLTHYLALTHICTLFCARVVLRNGEARAWVVYSHTSRYWTAWFGARLLSAHCSFSRYVNVRTHEREREERVCTHVHVLCVDVYVRFYGVRQRTPVDCEQATIAFSLLRLASFLRLSRCSCTLPHSSTHH
jgi:hypothetical protein